MRSLVIAVALLAPGCTFHKSELDETLEWMDNTYNAHENVSGSYGHGRMAWYAPAKSPSGERTEVLVSGETESFTYKGSRMTLHAESDPAGNEAEIVHKATFVFDLKDIDPASINVKVGSHLGDFSCEADADGEKSIMAENCDHAELNFKTRNEAGLIDEDWRSIFTKLTGADHESAKKDKTNSAYFVFNDPDYAKRFAKAFTHAVELCGGKASPF